MMISWLSLEKELTITIVDARRGAAVVSARSSFEGGGSGER